MELGWGWCKMFNLLGSMGILYLHDWLIIMVNVGKYTVNVGAYSTVDGSEIRRENHLKLVVDLPLFTTDSFAFQVVGLGISEPSTVGSMEQKRYIYQSMKR